MAVIWAQVSAISYFLYIYLILAFPVHWIAFWNALYCIYMPELTAMEITKIFFFFLLFSLMVNTPAHAV